METLIQTEATIVKQIEDLMSRLGPFVTLADASRITKVPLATLSEAVRLGRLPALRVQPRRWLIRISAVEAYFNQRLPIDKSTSNLFLDIANVAEGAQKSLSDMPTDFARNFDHYVYGTDKR